MSFNSWVLTERLSKVLWTSHLRISLPRTAAASSACICSISCSLEYSFSRNKLVIRVSVLSSARRVSYMRLGETLATCTVNQRKT